MLKKKNMAIMMAVATVATTAAPAFAAVETQNVDEATLIAQVEKLLATKYSDAKEDGLDDKNSATTEGREYTNAVYEIESNIAINESTAVKNTKVLKQMIEQAKLSDNNQKLVLTVTDKGHKEIDGKIVAEENTAKRFYKNDFTDKTNGLDKVGATLKSVEGTTEYATIELANGKEIELANGDYVLDMKKPVDANGNLIKVEDEKLDSSLAKRIAGFEVFKAPTKEPQDMPSKQISELTFSAESVNKIDKKASDILTKDGYTKDGAKLVNGIIDAKDAKNTTVINGVRYHVINPQIGNVEVVKNAGYKLEVTLDTYKDGDAPEKAQKTKVTIVGDVQKDLATIRTAMVDGDKDNKVVDVEGKVAKLVGDDRFQTAVEISKKAYLGTNDKAEEGKSEAKAIVLVGEEAIVDGLAAAPLASAADAPILLTKKDAVPTSTMNEIKRSVEKGAKIYLVGGEANISKDVEKQLVTEMNAEIVRLAGDDRNETSLKIAKELKTIKGNFSQHFVVGGDGLADAMSIASIAAKKGEEAPILVTSATGLTKDAKKFLEENKAEATVVGGESKVSTQVLKDIKAETNDKVTRLAGEDRHETNAKVIATLKGKNLANVYTAKSGYVPNNGDALLVDALAVAPLAAKTEGVIVLATDEVTKAQETAVKEAKTTGTKLTQVGGGVNANVIQKLVKILGL